MPSISYSTIFELTRGEIVESLHAGAIAVANAAGELLAWYGDPHTTTFLRSSAKPFQVLPFVESGGVQAFQLTPRELALMCASHSGTDEHVETARAIQAKAGVQEEDLLCGVHPLWHQPTVEAMAARGEALSPNRHNCSGKHSGMVAFARLLGLPYHLEDHPYIAFDHPIQQRILAAFAEMCSLPADQVHLGVDGCSAPNFAVPLQRAAQAFARLCQPDDLPEPRRQACRQITQAMTAHPEMVGGPESFDTRLMQVMQGKVVCKGGAEGYQALGLLPGALGAGSPGLGIVFKVADGDQRGSVRPAVTVEILRQLGALSPAELEALAKYGPSFPLYNFRKIHVGEARPCFKLHRAG
jgi:L-asparaginase II